jgi:predicted DsbA family dithiol-disulfide isomerase
VPLLERMAERFGVERLGFIQSRLKSMGDQEGINFSFKGKVGNTRDSHRLIQLGKTKGNETENRVVLELFKSYFEGTGDITSWDMLTEAAEKAGIDRQEAKTWLEAGDGGKQVDAEVDQAYARNIHGVPHFTIQGKYEVDGAQDPQAFIEAFAQARVAN